MTLNVENLTTLIAHLEAQPKRRIHMGYSDFHQWSLRQCGCIIAHAEEIFAIGPSALGLDLKSCERLFFPPGWNAGHWPVIRRYPAHRVIATLKRLRDHYLATGDIVVDWGPDPGAEPAQPWSAPQVVEVPKPALPGELTRFLDASQPADLVREG